MKRKDAPVAAMKIAAPVASEVKRRKLLFFRQKNSGRSRVMLRDLFHRSTGIQRYVIEKTC